MLYISTLCLPLNAVATDDCYKVAAKHYFLGRWELLIKPNAAKAVNLTEGYSVMCTAPDWKVTLFNDTTKLKSEMTWSRFLDLGLPITNGYTTDFNLAQGQAFVGHQTFKGMPVSVYANKRPGGKKRVAFTLAKMKDVAEVKASLYRLTNQIETSPKVDTFVQRLFTLPGAPGFPVSFVDIDADDKSNTVFEVIDKRKLPAGSVKIIYPSTYKTANNVRDVTVSNAQKDSLDEWAKSIKMGE
jgi:hypothetical protein